MAPEKRVVEDVSGWLTIYDDGTVDREYKGPPAVKFMATPVPPDERFINGVATKDVLVDSVPGLKVRIYLPEKAEGGDSGTGYGKLPVVLHFHGGGFCISQADWYMYHAVYSRLARHAGAIVVSVFLRLAPEHQLPAACDDGYSALLWLRSLARKSEQEAWMDAHADFSRVFLIGDSSGGNVVHQVALRAADEDLTPLKLAGAIPIHPGFVRSVRSKSETERPESPFLTLHMVDKFLNLALPLGSNKDHPITCPMSEAEKLPGLKLPPFLYCVADNDLIIDTEMEFYEEMKKAGKDIHLLTSSGVGHSFYLNKIAIEMDPQIAAEAEKLYQGIVDFINQH